MSKHEPVSAYEFDTAALTAADSTQINAVDLIGGDMTVIVIAGRQIKREGKVGAELRLENDARFYRPSKGMFRVLCGLYGGDPSKWPQRFALRLYCDGGVKFGGAQVGGVRISHASHIKGERQIPVAESRGAAKMVTIKPMECPPPPSPSGKAFDPAEVIAAFEAVGVPAEVVVGSCGGEIKASDRQRLGEALRAINKGAKPEEVL